MQRGKRCEFPVYSEAESKEKHGVWDPLPELTITSPYVHSRVDSNTFTMGNPMSKSTLTLCQSLLLSPSQRLWIWPLRKCQTTSTPQFYAAFRPNNIILMIWMRRNRFFFWKHPISKKKSLMRIRNNVGLAHNRL
jgi:hypothetical protein